MDLPTKESLTVEFKSDKQCYSMDKLYEDTVSMANTNGGRLFLGVEDNGSPTGVNKQHINVQYIEACIWEHTVPNLKVSAHIENWNGHDVLVIEIPASNCLIMTSQGKYLSRRVKRDGTPENVPMKPDEIVQRLSHIRAFDPSAQVIEDLPADVAFDSKERDRLRGFIKDYHGDQVLISLSDEDLDKALGFVREYNKQWLPTIAGLLMIGQESHIRQYVSGHEILFQVLDSTKVLLNPPAMHIPLLQAFEKIDLLFQSRINEQELQVGLFRVPIPNYEIEAFREGVINALVHRDYFHSGAVHIQLQNNAITISNPGGFVRGVSLDNLLSTPPTPRNTVLAEAIKRIGLAERTGRGINKIYMSMLRNGHSMPDYSDSTLDSVVLRLSSAELDENYIKMLITEEKRLDTQLSVDELIILSVLKTENSATVAYLSQKIQKAKSETLFIVDELVKNGLLERIGKVKPHRFTISSNVYTNDTLTNNESKEDRSRQSRKNTAQYYGAILDYLQQNSFITRVDVEKICQCTPNQASWLLRLLVKDNKLQIYSKGKNTFYKKVE